MPRYKIITLIDITRAEINRDEQDNKKKSQRSNFNSLVQAIGLRANPDWVRDPEMKTGRLPDPFSGKGNYWSWEFDIEREDVFLSNNNPVELLINDLHGVPIILGLDETVDQALPTFNLDQKNFNTHVEII